MSKTSAIGTIIFEAILIAGLLAVNLLVSPPTQALVKKEVSVRAIINAKVGQVQVRTKGTQIWREAEVGSQLAEGDEVRTGLFSEVTLSLPRWTTVTVSPNTSFVVGQKQIKRSSFELGEGSITAAIPKETDHSYQFRSKGSQAVASIEYGEFSMASDGKGTVVVDSQKGQVKLKSKGREVLVKKGRRSVVLPDKPPSEVLPIPTSVALQVKWPATKTDKNVTRVSGTTQVSSAVLINGIMVRSDDKGQFEAEVPLREGANSVVVTATDPAGNSITQQSPTIEVDTKPPDVDVNAQDLWK